MQLRKLIALAALLFASPSFAALTITLLDDGIDTTNNPASTASVDPASGSVGYACVPYAVAGGTGNTVTEDVIVLDGAWASWAEIAKITSITEDVNRRGIMVFEGTGAVTEEAISITATTAEGTWTETAWNIIQVTGQDADPSDAPTSDGAGSGTTSTVPDVGTVDAGDAIIQCIFHETSEAVSAAGWTALGAVTGGSDIRTAHSFYDDSSPDETPNATWATSSTWGAVGWIVNVGSGGGGGSVVPIILQQH